ncbi:MAG: YdjY domain-containing protein [Planctomycetia bacterium]|nr:YdjY domain-containing protein [Planctomycetia bacterium]
MRRYPLSFHVLSLHVLLLLIPSGPLYARSPGPETTPSDTLPPHSETRQSTLISPPSTLAELELTGPERGFTGRILVLRIAVPSDVDGNPLPDASLQLRLPEGLSMANVPDEDREKYFWYRDLTPTEIASGEPVELPLRVGRSGPMVLRIGLESETMPVAVAVRTIVGVEPLNPLPQESRTPTPGPGRTGSGNEAGNTDSGKTGDGNGSRDFSVWTPDNLAQRLMESVSTEPEGPDQFADIPPIDPGVVARTLGPDGPGADFDAPTTAMPETETVNKIPEDPGTKNNPENPWLDPANREKKRDLGEPIPESTRTNTGDSAGTGDTADAPRVKMIRLKPDEPVWIEQKNGRPVSVYVLGEICNRDCPLELFAGLGRHGKDHESIVRCPVLASTVHAALLVCGAEPGGPAQWEPEYSPPSGTEIEVLIRWKDEFGTVRQCRAQDWIRSVKTKKAIPYPFVFAGSQFVTNPHTGKVSYGADRDEEFICVSNFPYATLDIPVESTDDNALLEFEAWTEQIPPCETPVTLHLKPVLKP